MKTRQCFYLIKIQTLLALLVLLPVWASAQQPYFYTFNGEKVELEEAANEMVVKLAPNVDIATLQSLFQDQFPDAEVRAADGIKTEGFYIIRSESDLHSARQQLRETPQVQKVQPVYLINGGPLVPYDAFVIKLASDSEFARMQELNSRYNVELVSRNVQLSNLITLRMRDYKEGTVLELAQRYFHELDLKYSTPDFLQEIVRHGPVNDPYFTYQFYMHMIAAEDTWNISRGSNNITVAVIDDGVSAHEDLPGSRIVNGYDAFGVTNGAPGGNEAHGMAVTGIIAASHNQVGVAGLAPNVQVMPVRIFDNWGRGLDIEGTEIVDAFSHAVSNGAHVINNSWGSTIYSDPNTNPSLTNVITDAMQNGRDGLGTVIIFSSGNNGNEQDPTVRYPATIPGVISVGAVDENDNHFGYSAEGPELDIVSPSGDGVTVSAAPCSPANSTTTLHGNVWTLDHDGVSGVNPGDHNVGPPNCYNKFEWTTHSGQSTPDQAYTAHFGGTSASAPQISGAAALMLTVNPDLSLNDLRDALHTTAKKVSGMNGQSFTNEYGHGRLNAYEAVKASMAQYHDHAFLYKRGGTLTFNSSAHLTGANTVGGEVTLVVPENRTMLIDGSLTSTGDDAVLEVEGRLLVYDNRSINNIDVTIHPGGELIVRDQVTFDLDEGLFTVDGDAIIGSGFTMKDGIVDIGSGGSMDLEGSALFEFIEVPVAILPGFPPLYMMPRMNIRGTFTSTIPPNNITMRLSPNSTFGEWNGITVFSSSEGSKLWGLTIEDAKTGIHLSAVDDVHLWHVNIDSPSQAGLVSMSSNPFAAGVNIINSGGMGVDISGGNPDIGYFDADGNSESGVRSANYATTYMPEGSVSGSGAGSSYAGVWVENASHTHINGTIGSVAGWQAAAVNDAWAWFNGTTWVGGTPYIYVDGSSQLYVQNPNNPQKAQGGEDHLQAELLHEWSERYREDRSEAVSWLANGRSTLPQTQQAVASVLLADHYIAAGDYDQADHLLASATSDRHGDHLAPGALAQRQVLLAVHGPENETLGRNSMEQLRQADLDTRHLALLEGLMERRYGPAQDQPGQDEPLAESQPKQAELGNYPNPFNPVTSITYTLPQQDHITLEVFDMTGRRVALLADQVMPAGRHSVSFDGSSLASGVYFYRLSAGTIVKTNTLTLIK